jgi:hypothetical protein
MCFWFDQVQQIIFEENKCIGVSLIAGGNGIMTYGGGVAHHVYSAGNLFTQVWGNDREVMTYDNRGNQYLGPVTSITDAGTNISTLGRGAADGNGNGYDVVGSVIVFGDHFSLEEYYWDSCLSLCLTSVYV